jgi:hypothetical protein
MNDERFINPEMPPVPAYQPAKGMALAVFLCGLGSIVCCMPPAAIVGLILGGIAKKKGNRSGLRRAGVICSIVGLILTVAVIVLGVFMAMDYMETAHLSFSEAEGGWAVYVKAGDYPEHMELPSEYNGIPVVAIGENAFTDAEGIVTVTVPDTVTVIEKNAFAHSEKLKSIILPEGVTVIGDFAFRDCPKLVTVELPASLESIGVAALFTDSNLKTIRYHGTMAQWKRIDKARNWYEKKQYGKLEIICEDGVITLTEE